MENSSLINPFAGLPHYGEAAEERGGIVTREYGEPAQSVPFIEPEPEEEVTVKKKPLFKSRVDAELEGQGA